MMKLVRAGKVPGAKLEGVRRDAAEEARAARWFERVKEPVEVRSEDGLRLHGWMMPAARGTRENDATGTLLGKGKHRSRDTVHGAVGCHAVQHGVWSVATPLPVLNYVIALVRAR